MAFASTIFGVGVLLQAFVVEADLVTAFAQLNGTVGGRLRAGIPLAEPCYSNYSGRAVTPDPAACAVVQQNYTSDLFIADHYSGFINVHPHFLALLFSPISISFS